MKEKKYLIIGIVSTLILMLGFTLAYFTPQIIGEGKKMTVNTANLEIIFTDTSEVLVEDEITPGWSTSKSFTVENKSNSTFYFDITMKEYINTFVLDYLEYKITSSNGYNMTEYKPLPKSKEEAIAYLKEGISIEVGETHSYTIEFRYKDVEENQAEDMNKTFEGMLAVEEGSNKTYSEGTLASQLKKDNTDILGRINFDNVYEEENVGTLYKASGSETEDIDNDGIGENVYYFAGNAQNNWVKFGKDQDDADLYWRIIRTNEDGGVRLLYIGPDPATESAFISIDGTLQDKVVYNGMEDANTQIYNMYVGYMYGITDNMGNYFKENYRDNTINSPIKTVTDTWYSKTINEKTDESGNIYDSYVSKTAIYCNDRNIAYSEDIWLDFGTSRRLYYAKSPSYKCGVDASRNLYSTADVADKFSVSTSKGGNGMLTYPIALITADEVAYAGGVFETSSQAWYYYNSVKGSVVEEDWWWTMSPFVANDGEDAYVGIVSGEWKSGWSGGTSYQCSSLPEGGIRPVLSLKSCVKYVSGDGSSDSPYEVNVDSTCVSALN